MKIWNTREDDQNQVVDKFLSGEDILLDRELFLYDVQSSIAHVEELRSIGVLNNSESRKLKAALKKLGKLFKKNKFKLTNKFEDSHSAIEYFLIKELGDVGKKIHTGRSRNDQVLTALRLCYRDKLGLINKLILASSKILLEKAKTYQKEPMPGYTHLQRAVPSSWGLWFSAFAEAFLDDVELINRVSDWINLNPLGTGAGFGVNLPIKRDISTQILGFKRKQLNSLYTQNSRGKFELEVAGVLKQPMLDMRKLTWDMSLFLTQEFNLINIGKRFTTGSSIMPNKINPDVVELIRGNYSILAGTYSELENLLSLPSGYHRDLQITKRSILHSFEIVIQSFSILPDLLKSISINKMQSNEFIDEEMMMTDYVYELVKTGTPFREAYHHVKENKNELKNYKLKNIKNASIGSANNLKLNHLNARLKKLSK
jgi:argininosuccinate lyase